MCSKAPGFFAAIASLSAPTVSPADRWRGKAHDVESPLMRQKSVSVFVAMVCVCEWRCGALVKVMCV